MKQRGVSFNIHRLATAVAFVGLFCAPVIGSADREKPSSPYTIS